jgi:hypothetical protein
MFLLQEYIAEYCHVGSSCDGLRVNCLLRMDAIVKIHKASASGKIFPLKRGIY